MCVEQRLRYLRDVRGVGVLNVAKYLGSCKLAYID